MTGDHVGVSQCIVSPVWLASHQIPNVDSQYKMCDSIVLYDEALVPGL